MKHTHFDSHNNPPMTADDPRLTAWVLGELPPEEAASVAAAVAANAELATAAADLRALTADLDAAFATELATATSAATVVTAAAAKAATVSTVTVSPWSWAMPLAASFVLVGLIGSALWWQGGFGTRVTDDVTWLPPVGASRPAETAAPAAKVEPAGAIIDPAGEPFAATVPPMEVAKIQDFQAVAESERRLPQTFGGAAPAGAPNVSARIRGYVAAVAQEGRGTLGDASAPPPPPAAPAEWASQDVYDPTLTDGFRPTAVERFTTIGLDADTASWNVVRRTLRQGSLVPRNAVRVEELINAFPTNDAGPAADSPHPVAVTVGAMPSPWAPERVLVRVAVKGREVTVATSPRLNLVFLVDVSGSMNSPDRLPLVKEGLISLAGQLGPRDRLSLVTYAGRAAVVLEPVAGDQQDRIRNAIGQLGAGGGTAGGEGLRLAYEMAQRHFDPEGINRIILCTDGDFNLGNNDRSSLADQVQAKAKEGIYLNAFGFGMGNLHDGRLRELARHGQGAYGYISDRAEAEFAFVDQSRALLVPVAREVKAQVEFNPAVVAAWRIFGHDDRRLAREDFLDDKKDGGELGSGQVSVAVYEVILADSEEGRKFREGAVLAGRYASEPTPARAGADELLVASVRYQPVGGGEGRTLTQVLPQAALRAAVTPDLSFTAAIVGFALHLRGDEGLRTFGWPALRRLAVAGLGPEADARRVALLEAIGHAEALRN